MRTRAELFDVGDTVEDSGAQYVVVTVEPPPS